MKKGEFDLSKIQPHPTNPRTISEQEVQFLERSLQAHPEFLKAHPIAYCSQTGYIFGGNQRYKALIKLGYASVPQNWVQDISDWSEGAKIEFMFIDNKQSGEWDWDIINTEYEALELGDWGIVGKENSGAVIKEEDFGEGFDLKSGDKEPFQQVSFCLSDEQAGRVREAIAEIKKTEEYKYVETFGNANTNGNALYLIIQQWAQKIL